MSFVASGKPPAARLFFEQLMQDRIKRSTLRAFLKGNHRWTVGKRFHDRAKSWLAWHIIDINPGIIKPTQSHGHRNVITWRNVYFVTVTISTVQLKFRCPLIIQFRICAILLWGQSKKGRYFTDDIIQCNWWKILAYYDSNITHFVLID